MNCVLLAAEDAQGLRTSDSGGRLLAQFALARPMRPRFVMGGGVSRFTNLRAWQACEVYKKAAYQLCDRPPLATDWKRRGQLEESVRGPGAHIAEGFGRFSPPDFARFVVIARASLMKSQHHLIDLVDRGYITDAERLSLNGLAEIALQETTGLLEYLQSPEALRNARRARDRRIVTRDERRSRNSEP